jgi:hypothetical protein
MANELVRISVTVQDIDNVRAIVQAFATVPDTETLANMKTAVQAYVTALAPLLGGDLIRAEYTPLPAFTGLKAGAASDSHVYEAVNLQFNLTNLPYKWGQALASIKDSKLASGKLDTTDTDVAAYITLMTGAFAGGTFTDNKSIVIAGYEDSFRGVRKHRRALRAGSYQVGS